MLKRQQKKLLLNILKYVVPVVSVTIIVTLSVVIYTASYITRPVRTKYPATLEDYSLVGIRVPKTDESWSLKGGGRAEGWLLRASTGAPAIIISHSYGQNLADFLSLGVALQRAGYHVLLYDLRGHGQSKVLGTSLGDIEVDDLLAAIAHLRTLRDADGNTLVDPDRVGLYGVSLGGYASLVAAGQEKAVKAVVVDAVYPDVPTYLKLRIKAFSTLSNSLLQRVTELGMKYYYSSKYGTTSAEKIAIELKDTKKLFILGKDAQDLQLTTAELYQKAAEPKESIDVPHSRVGILYKSDQDVYDPVVVDFFRRPDVLSPIAIER
jgi:pimeloyl-ACP methyl ester carboxylesterase